MASAHMVDRIHTHSVLNAAIWSKFDGSVLSQFPDKSLRNQMQWSQHKMHRDYALVYDDQTLLNKSGFISLRLSGRFFLPQ